MNAPNRVDELRKRYHENPRRFFAPLANEYRKTGFVDRAILLCEKHLAEQPGNMNGLVVYGQCLFETGRLEDARQPFEMALSVDPENLIALRHLGDIARLGGDAPKAREWYERVLEFDRRNEEVIALMAEVGGGEEKPATTSQAPNIVSVAGSVRVTTGAQALGLSDTELASAPIPPAERVSAAAVRPRTPVDASAKTVEVSAQPKPAPRGSLMNVSFDFGEIGVAAETPAPPAPEPVLPAEAAEYGFAAPEMPSSAEEHLDAMDAFVNDLPSAPAPIAPRSGRTPSRPHTPIFESAVENESLASMGEVEGIEKAEYSADVSALDGLEPTEFQPPDRPSALIEGLESEEFQPLGLEETSAHGLEVTHDDPFGGDTSVSHAETFDASAAEGHVDDHAEHFAEESDESLGGSDAPSDPRASMAGLPLLQPYGTPTPFATPTVSDLPLLPSLEEAETIPIDLEAARRAMETPPTFVTETMAQVYVQQGHTDKAIEVYRQLIAQSPNDAGLRERLRALETPPAPTPAPVPAPDSRATFGFDTPLSTEPVEEHAPANSMLSATSFDGIMLSTPETPSRSATPVQASPVVAPLLAVIGQSAREFFSRFVHRAATPSWTPSVEGAPTIGGQLMSPLDELFGTSVPSEDEVAAHRLAGVGATSGPSGGSALDSLFGEGPSAPMPTTTPSRGSVSRASEKLRFDQFFASSTPVQGSIDTPDLTPAPEPIAALDEAPSVAESGEPGEDDDLDQFQGWLRGLTS